ncbi:MAG: hypothetical protein N2312_06530 [Dictyoglomaceae bacterium]|nr:hypothetical protein [Dictyoglomaceae bacterium]
MRKIFIILLVLLSLLYAETVPVIINDKEYKGEKVKDYIFVPDVKLVLYQDNVFELKKIDNIYISEDLELLYDGKDVFKVYLSKGFILCPDKNILIRGEKKYDVKNIDKIYFSILSYNYNFSGVKLFAYGIYPRMRYILLEVAIFNLDKNPIVLDQKMFTLRVGNRDYYPDPAISTYFATQGEEVLLKRLIQSNEVVIAYLIYDVHGLPDLLKIDPYYGLKKTLEIKLQ